MLSMLPSAFVLGLAAFAALLLVQSRQPVPDGLAQRLAAARALALATGCQGIHFVEEAATGFHEQIPVLLGLPAMPFSAFVVFNLAWLGAWIASVPGLRSARAAAFFAAWFLAIAGMFNGVVHPLLAVAAGGYIPGLVSSPFIAGASVLLWLRLRAATRSRNVAEQSTRFG